MFDIERYKTLRLNGVHYDYVGNLEYLCNSFLPTADDFYAAEELINNGHSTDDYKGFAESILINTDRKNGTVFAITGNIGSGKSTFIHLLFENNMLGSDTALVLEDIYKKVFFDDVDKIKVAYSYAKSFVKKKILDYCNSNKNFVFEFVPSNSEKIEILDALKSIGYRIVVFFIKTDDVNINVSRVKNRVKNGADYVSEAKVRSRESLTNDKIDRLLSCSDEFYCYDSNDGVFLLFSYKISGEEMITVNEEKPV